ncbi:MAG: NAD(P)/FAD-dependent oxidoreductase [Spirochaetales bacterium]|nr:NAD(P)/FAD-dependent oxidoreductase [Spirochaetales bacterium]
MNSRNRTVKTLHIISRELRKKGFPKVKTETCYDGKSIRLSGKVQTWQQKIEAGYIAASHSQKFKGIVNDIAAESVHEPLFPSPGSREFDETLDGLSYDVVIIGAGVIGCFIARELARYELSVAVLEKETDAAMHASGRNDGMIHPGFAPKPGTLRAKYNSKGNSMYPAIAEELDIEYRQPGSILLFSSSWMRLLAPVLRYRCKRNGVAGNYRYLTRMQVQNLEPHVTYRQKGGFYFPTAGIVSPFQVTIACAEHAVQNGAVFHRSTCVTGFKSLKRKNKRQITGIITNHGIISANVVINAAGIWADYIAGMADDQFFSIHGRKGTDAILDKKTSRYQKHIMAMPSLLKTAGNHIHSKGGGIVVCIEGNTLLGPTAEEVPDREDYSTHKNEFRKLEQHLSLNTRLKKSDIINYYSGVRAATWKEDFIVEKSERVPNLVHAAGIQSPGLASAPAIAIDICKMVLEILSTGRVEKVEKTDPIPLKQNFIPCRQHPPVLKLLSNDEKKALIRKNPLYGNIICRCEEISEGEVRDALHSSLPAVTIDGIKRRTRAGTGRCHGGFCLSKVLEIISSETGIPKSQITRKGGDSRIIIREISQTLSSENKKDTEEREGLYGD